jgi:hypothetical protein
VVSFSYPPPPIHQLLTLLSVGLYLVSHYSLHNTHHSINRPGGHGKITKVEVIGNATEEYDDTNIRLTVKYVLGGCDKDLDPCLVEVPQDLGTRTRKPPSRSNVLTPAVATETKSSKPKRMKKAKLGNSTTTTSTSSSHNKKPRPHGTTTTTTAAAASKENTQNRKSSETSTGKIQVSSGSGHKITQQPRRRRRSTTTFTSNTNKKCKKTKHKWPKDLPSEIVIPRHSHSNPSFTSPINDKGAEEGRKYMLPQNRKSPQNQHYRPLFPSTDLLGSGSSTHDDDDYDVDDPEEDELMMMTTSADDDVSESNVVLKSSAAASGGVPVVSSSFLTDTKQVPSASDMKVVEQQSAAATTTTSTVPILKRVTVKSVVDQEMKQAADFVSDMLQCPPGEQSSFTAAAATTTAPASTTTTSSPRQEQLMKVFLSVMDHNEGTVEEDELVQQINQHQTATTTKAVETTEFPSDEIHTLLQTLVQNNKIMRCDNHIYWL